MTPESAIEAAMDALDESWVTDASREQLRGMMRAVLEAAAPYMTAQAWEEGSVAGWVESGLPHSWNAENSLRNANPYRLTP